MQVKSLKSAAAGKHFGGANPEQQAGVLNMFWFYFPFWTLMTGSGRSVCRWLN